MRHEELLLTFRIQITYILIPVTHHGYTCATSNPMGILGWKITSITNQISLQSITTLQHLYK